MPQFLELVMNDSILMQFYFYVVPFVETSFLTTFKGLYLIIHAHRCRIQIRLRLVRAYLNCQIRPRLVGLIWTPTHSELPGNYFMVGERKYQGELVVIFHTISLSLSLFWPILYRKSVCLLFVTFISLGKLRTFALFKLPTLLWGTV